MAAHPPHSSAVPVKVIHRKLTLLPLVMVLFFTVSGGAYGLEDLVSASGPGMALLLIVVTPIIWSLPVALMVGELSTALPLRGGFYAWVQTGLGPFWGFLAGWWVLLTSFVDMAIYPVLFADYLSTLLTQQFGFRLIAENPLLHWLITLVIIWVFAALNIRGAKTVGDFSKLFGIFILAPFAVMAVLGIYQWMQNPIPVWQPLVPPDSGIAGAFGVGLFVAMWNYMGWDMTSTISAEIDNPQRNFPLSMAVTIPLVTLVYLLPTFAGLVAAPDWTKWTAGYFPEAAAAVGGKWLGAWVAIGGLISAAGLFSAIMLSISRLPFAMAEDGYLPKILTRTHPRFHTPHVAIIVCAAIYSLFTLSAFASLVVVDVILYSAALLLEFAALIALRIHAPHLPRPYRVPGGWAGVVIITCLPVAVLALAIYSTLQEEGVRALYLSLAAIFTGPLVYPFLKRGVKKQCADETPARAPEPADDADCQR
ncbi:MAG: APC family permease [Gammaproteobacteria bacterium]